MIRISLLASIIHWILVNARGVQEINHRRVLNEEQAKVTAFQGDSSCPCLSIDDLDSVSFDSVPESTVMVLGRNRTNITSYGFNGCMNHDFNSSVCSDNACATANASACDDVPKFCDANWCFVDHRTCKLLSSPSIYFPESNRFYSYATCGEIDDFTTTFRVPSLSGKKIKIALNNEDGGYLGAYQINQQQFTGPLETWTGPILDFVRQAAAKANFTIELVEPPEILRNKSVEYWGGSPFDMCVYAASLGYLDLCVGTYIISSRRASVTPWIHMTDRNLYLLVKDETYDSYYGWYGFTTAVATIFLPFTAGTWLFLILFVLPVMGGLFVVHEYGNPNSPYQATESVLVIDNDTRQVNHEIQKVPMNQFIARSIYMGYLSLLRQIYASSVVSPGTRLHIIGMTFFILTTISVYVANLASMLTRKVNKTEITTLDGAIRAGYRICATRKIYEVVSGIYKVPATSFAKDPKELGGDGLPGFDCPLCGISTRGIEYLDPIKAQTDENYCHATLTFRGNLAPFLNKAEYCHLQFVGDAVAQLPDGLPVFEGISEPLMTHFYQLQNAGLWRDLRDAAEPRNLCTPSKYITANLALGIFELSGIWSGCAIFTLLGVAVTFLIIPCLRRRQSKQNPQIKRVHIYNQYGDKVPDEDIIDQFLSKECQRSSTELSQVVSGRHQGRLQCAQPQPNTSGVLRSWLGENKSGSTMRKRKRFEDNLPNEEMNCERKEKQVSKTQ